MSPEIIARLTREAEAPEGIAVRVSGPEMKALLHERQDLLDSLNDVWVDVEANLHLDGMRQLQTRHAVFVKIAVQRARK